MLVLKHVTKTYGTIEALSDVSLRIDPGEFVCLVGPSGAGKSTLLRLLIGMEIPTKGSVEADGADLRKVPSAALQIYRRRVGMMFQDGKLLEHATVRENVAFPLEVCGVSDAVIAKRVPVLLQHLTLNERKDAFPRQLSAGEKTRTALARAIVHRPMILLADEPTGTLDPEQSERILHLLKELHDTGTTVILATHDASLVDTLKTRVIRLEGGKITRDSVGGYEHAPAKAKQSQQLFTEREPEALDLEEGAVERKRGGSPKRPSKKVKITSIGSM